MKYDVIIIGGGIIGCATALTLLGAPGMARSAVTGVFGTRKRK